MERHCPGFMKLGLANDENALVEVDIRQLEGEGFGNAQPSAIQKSQQREVRLGPEGPSRRKSGRFREEGAKLDVAVDMWSEARTLPWPPRAARHIGLRVSLRDEPPEDPHRVETL